MPDICLTLLCAPAAEEKLLDLLLMSPSATVFTSMATAIHGLDHKKLDPMEKVLGRARATQIQVIFAEADKAALLEEIHHQMSGTGLRYWLTTVVEAGEVA